MFMNICPNGAQKTYPLILCALLLLRTAEDLSAIMFYSTSDLTYNTTPPQGALAESGWHLQGLWGAYLGTPIAPHYFITAGHVGGTVGDRFILNGREYTTIEMFDDPGSDLRIWRTCEPFSEYAPLYNGALEINQAVVLFGRGTRRGSEVRVSNGLTTELKGWRWGDPDGTLRWGENRVAAILPGDGLPPLLDLEGTVGDVLQCQFNADAGPNEAHLSSGDSGGALFIQESGVWTLAGIHLGVDGPYNTTNSGEGFMAAIFDEGGLYKGEPGNWGLVLNLPVDIPGTFYSTRISSNREWINGVLATPGSADLHRLQSSANAAGTFTDDSSATVNVSSRTILANRSGEARFYRLRSCTRLRITDVQVNGDSVAITYE